MPSIEGTPVLRPRGRPVAKGCSFGAKRPPWALLRSERRRCSKPRAASVLNGRAAAIQEYLGSRAEGEDLYAAFAEKYARDLAVKGEDMVAAYSLAGAGPSLDQPGVRRQVSPLTRNPTPTPSPTLPGGAGAHCRKACGSMTRLFSELAENGEISPRYQAEVETLITTEDAAMQSVIAAFRDEDLGLKTRRRVAGASDGVKHLLETRMPTNLHRPRQGVSQGLVRRLLTNRRPQPRQAAVHPLVGLGAGSRPRCFAMCREGMVPGK